MAYVNKYSQRGEEVVIQEIFEVLGIEKGHLVDLGAGDGYTLSNTRALLERGWTGTLLDGDPRGAKDVQKVWITKELAAHFGSMSCDFLNIDLDGNDYWILREFIGHDGIGEKGPSLIVAEYNPIFPRDEAVVMPYNEAHVWNNDTYYGMSLAAVEMLAKEFGYTLIHLHGGINAFLLRNDHAAAHPELIEPIDYKIKFGHRSHPPGKQWTKLN